MTEAKGTTTVSIAATISPKLSCLVEPFKSIVSEVLEQESEKYDVLESKLRNVLLERSQALWTDLNSSDEDDGGAETKNLKDLQLAFTTCIDICKEMPLDGLGKIAFVLLEDIVESVPLDQLQLFYEQTQPITLLCQSESLWKTKTKGGTPVLQFIRVCNQFLKRLPPQSEWTGRILLQLADRLPMTDRSSIKPWGSVAGSETFTYHDANEYQGDDGDYTFYQTFWSLQQDFANPYQVSFGTFVAKFQKVLTALEANCSSRDIDCDSLRYLTHSRLLTPQLESSKSLRLHILTQFCIIEAFLSTQSPSLQTALEPLAKRSKLLLETLDSNHWSVLNKLLVEREVMWRNWKKNKCQPPMQLPPVVPMVLAKPTASATDTNSNELDFLKPISMLELQGISRAIRAGVPTLQAHLEQYVEALDPEAGIEEEYSPKRDKVMGWQALRLSSQQYLSYFKYIMPNGDFENLVRHAYAEELNQDIPGELLSEVDVNDADDRGLNPAGKESKPAETEMEPIERAVEEEQEIDSVDDGEMMEDDGQNDATSQKELCTEEKNPGKKGSKKAVHPADIEGTTTNADVEEDDVDEDDIEEDGEELEEEHSTENKRDKRPNAISELDSAISNDGDDSKVTATSKLQTKIENEGMKEGSLKEKSEDDKSEMNEHRVENKKMTQAKQNEEENITERQHRDPPFLGNQGEKGNRRPHQNRRQDSGPLDERQETSNKRRREDEPLPSQDRRTGGHPPANRHRGPPHGGRGSVGGRGGPPPQVGRGPPPGSLGRGGSHGPPEGRGRGPPPPSSMGRGGAGRDDRRGGALERRGGPHDGGRDGGGQFDRRGGPHEGGRDDRRGGGQPYNRRR